MILSFPVTAATLELGRVPEPLTKNPDRRAVWNQRHGQSLAADQPPEHAVTIAASLAPPGVALDLACGLGRHALYLASVGWRVTAVDYSDVALTSLRERAAEAGLPCNVIQADLEAGEFSIEPNTYDLICDCCYLDRNLFAAIRDGVRPGGLFVGALPIESDSAPCHAMNPVYLLAPGELAGYFAGWQVLHAFEGRRTSLPYAELVVRRP